MEENLGIVIYENAQSMDIIGPWEVLSFWKTVLQTSLNMYLISENSSYVKCVNDITLKAHADFESAPKLDYLIVPGGPGRLNEVNNDKLISFIKNQSHNCKYILSDCTGMFLLYQAGLLKGQSVTTYWRALPELKSLPDINIIEERIVKSGKIWTSGGVSSGIDLAFELIAELSGREVAGKVQLLFEYFPSQSIFCDLESFKALPPYQGNVKTGEQQLATYIRDYILSKDKSF